MKTDDSRSKDSQSSPGVYHSPSNSSVSDSAHGNDNHSRTMSNVSDECLHEAG